MINLFRFVGLRHLRIKPLRSALTTLGVALGIALFIAIRIINDSTLKAFRENYEAVAGKATLVVTAGETGFPETVLETVKKVPSVQHAVPMVESRAYFAGDTTARETLVVMGVDLLKEQAVRTYKTTDEQVIDDPLIFLNQPDSVIVTHAFARDHHLKLDSKFQIATARGRRPLTVRGLLSPSGPAKAYGGAMAIMDIDGAQVTFGKEGRLDRIDIITRPGVEVPDALKALQAALGPSFKVERPETQSQGMEKMVESYQFMMSFFSTLALLVGLFLVANSISISVAERKREIGTLRALGATRTGILALFLSEAVAMGTLGALAGAGLGRLIAGALVRTITQAMSSQFLTKIDVAKLNFGMRDLALAVALGAGSSLTAALWPALRATQIQPLEAMKHRDGETGAARGFLAYSPYLGVFLLAYASLAASLHWVERYHWLDVVNQIATMLGAILVAPTSVALLLKLSRLVVPQTRSTVSRLAQDNLLRNPTRTGSNVMSLMVGLMLVIMISVVNTSFRLTMIEWFDRILSSDLLVSSQGQMISYQMQPLHESLEKEFDAIPGIASFGGKKVFGMRFVHTTFAGRPVAIKAWDKPRDVGGLKPFDVVDRDRGEAVKELFDESSALPALFVSENFVLHFGKKTGDTIELPTPTGSKPFRVAAVMNDFASNEGVIYLSREVYKRLFKDPLISAFGMRLAPGAQSEDVRRAIDRSFGAERNLMVVSNKEIRQQMIDVIDRSFAGTRAIETAALLVGLLGLLNTMLISVMERQRELGMLRAVGMARGQLSRMIVLESLWQGGLGAVVAIALGSFFSYLWITFSLAQVLGWMIGFHFSWESVIRTVLVGLVVAGVAGYFPARRAAALQIREALEYE